MFKNESITTTDFFVWSHYVPHPETLKQGKYTDASHVYEKICKSYHPLICTLVKAI